MFGSRYGQAIFLGLNQPSSERMPDASPPVIRGPRRVAGHSPPFTAELKNEWSCTSNLLCDFMARTEQLYVHRTRVRCFCLCFERARCVSRDVAADAGFLCNTAAVLGAAIKETL